MVPPVAVRLAWLGSLVAAALAQQPGATFRATTRLVEINVTALDGKGKPVTGLDPADFEILDGGKRREIAFFRFDAAPPEPAEPLPPGAFSNREQPAAGKAWNVSALVLDSLNTPPQANAQVRAQLMRYLQAMTPETRVAIYSMGGTLDVLHEFTSDAESLRARVAKAAIGMPLESIVSVDQLAREAENILASMDNDPQVAEMLERSIELQMLGNAAAQRSRLERTLAAIGALGQHLSQAPGRKNLIWITAGFSMLSVTGNMGFGPRGSIDSYENRVRACAQQLAQHGVTLYIVDTAMLKGPQGSDVSVKPSTNSRTGGRAGRFEAQVQTAELSADSFSTMRIMADITGGRYLYNNNDLMRGFIEAANDLRGSYTLGFYSTGDPDGRWHSLKVKAKRSGLRLRHREGYIAIKDVAPPDPNAWRAAALSGVGSSNILLSATSKTGGGGLEVDLRIDPAGLEFRKEGGNFIAQVMMIFADRSANGTSRETSFHGTVKLGESQMQAARKTGVHHVRSWTPGGDAVETRIVVRDNATGKYGTLNLPVRRIMAGN